MTESLRNRKPETGNRKPETGNRKPETGLTPSDYYAIRKHRYDLRNVVARIYPASQTARCSVTPAPGLPLKIYRSLQTSHTFIAGTLTCSNLWICPICSAKISERRKQELQAGLSRFVVAGGHIYMLTATIPHRAQDSLRITLSALLRAWRESSKSHAGRQFRRSFSIVGNVRGLECTYSAANGWHPHIHALLFAEIPFSSLYAVRDEFFTVWRHECQKLGLSNLSPAHSIRVDSGISSDYLISSDNWGFSGELTKSHLKSSRIGSSFTPFDLLRLSIPRSYPPAESLFIAYAQAFRGRRQLVYSPGLKHMLGISEKSDEIINNESQQSAYEIAEIPQDIFRKIVISNNIPRLLQLSEIEPNYLSLYLQTFT